MAKADSILTTTVVVLLVCVGVQGADDERPEINSKYFGVIRGQVRKSEDGRRVNEFLGIPYAQAPVGNLRFHITPSFIYHPKPYEAVNMPPACLQYSEQHYPWYDSDPGQSEDCLYLNVWAPADIGDVMRPVKMYVHGGGWFETGSNRMGYYDGFGEALDTLDEDGNSKHDGIVVVTVNYRLGALGFLSSGTDDAPGNVGQADLWLAYYFVYYNVEYFGGNSNKLTIVGQGSGAILASLLKTLPGSSPKFVLNGATFLTLKALEGVDDKGDSYDNNLRLTDVLADAVDCKTSVKVNPKDTIECLRGVNATLLVKVMASISRKGPPNVFLPQFKGNENILISDPYMALHEHTLTAVQDVLATVTSDEGSPLLTAAFPRVFGEFGEYDIPLSAVCAKKVTRRFLKKFQPSVVDALLGDLDRHATTENRKKVIQAFGDAYFNCPVLFYAEEQKRMKSNESSRSKVYILEKQVNPPYKPFAPWMGYVDFYNVQIDFLHPDGKLTVNNKTYTYTDEQSKQARVNTKLLASFANSQQLPIAEYATENPSFSILGLDSNFETKSKFHGLNCDILRPYFEYKNVE